jgi:hypothetical protein
MAVVIRTNGVVEIGTFGGKVAVFFDESEAWDYHDSLWSNDGFRQDLAKAIVTAYPPKQTDEEAA